MITTELLRAPKYDQVRTNIQWSEEGQLRYAELVGPYLRQARETWLHPNSQTCMSVMLSITNSLMTKCATKCATKTNQFKILEAKTETKSRKIPQVIKGSRGKMIRAHTRFKLTEKSLGPDRLQVPHNRSIFFCNKKKNQHAMRHLRLKDNLERYHKLDEIFTKPTSAYSYLRSCRRSKASKIEKLIVGDKVYVGQAVSDGFYDSMTSLKQCDIEE